MTQGTTRNRKWWQVQQQQQRQQQRDCNLPLTISQLMLCHVVQSFQHSSQVRDFRMLCLYHQHPSPSLPFSPPLALLQNC